MRNQRRLIFLLSMLMIASLALVGAAAAQDAPATEDAPRPFLGVTLTTNPEGAEVVRVVRGSPASDAGLQRGDIITAVDGEAVTSETLPQTILGYDPDDTVTLTVQRDGDTLEIAVTLGQVQDRAFDGVPRTRIMTPSLGITVEVVDNGLQVTSVQPESPAEEAGIEPGDVITSIGGNAVSTVRDARTALIESLLDGETVSVELLRDGETLMVEVTIPATLPDFEFDFPRGEGRPFEFNGPGMMRVDPDRARLGVRYVTLDEATAAEYETNITEGALILEVQPDSPADEAGLLADDIITAVDGDLVDVERTLADRLFAYEPDDVVTLTVLREGETREIDVTLGQFERGQDFFFFGPPDEGEMPFPMPPQPDPETTAEPAL